jgi:uncharacterized membrane protein YbhN (UPF0104 family)
MVFSLGGVNLWLLLNSISKIPLKSFMSAYVYGYALNLFAPGQLGDVSVAIFLKSDGMYYSRSTLAYVVDKAISMVCLVSIGYCGARYLFDQYIMSAWMVGIPLVFILCAIIVVVVILYVKNTNGYVYRIKQLIINMYSELKAWNNKSKAILLNTVVTVCKWIVLSCTYYMAFYTFGVKVQWPEIGIIPIISTLIGYIPISIGGIGTVELCAVYLFSLISIDRVYVIDVYLFLRFITYVQAGIILGLCNWQFRRARVT